MSIQVMYYMHRHSKEMDYLSKASCIMIAFVRVSMFDLTIRHTCSHEAELHNNVRMIRGKSKPSHLTVIC